LSLGQRFVLDRKFQRRGFWELITERRITWINAVPALLAILARDGSPSAPSAFDSSGRASAALPEAVRGAVVDAFGDVLVESYGMTEAGSQITATELSLDPSPRGSVGRAIGVELQVGSMEGKPPSVRSAASGSGRRRRELLAGGRASERFDAGDGLTPASRYLDQPETLHVGRADDVINRARAGPSQRDRGVLLADPRSWMRWSWDVRTKVLGEVQSRTWSPAAPDHSWSKISPSDVRLT